MALINATCLFSASLRRSEMTGSTSTEAPSKEPKARTAEEEDEEEEEEEMTEDEDDEDEEEEEDDDDGNEVEENGIELDATTPKGESTFICVGGE